MEKKMRKRLFPEEAILLNIQPKKAENGRNQTRYSITHKQWLKVLEHRFKQDDRRFVEKIRKLDKHGEVTSTTEKLEAPLTEIPDGFKIIKISKSPTTGQEWVQYAPGEVEKVNYDAFEEVVKKYSVSLFDNIKADKSLKNDFDTLTFTDVHIGMDTDKYKNTMYKCEWNGDVLMNQAKIMIQKTLNFQKSNTLVIDDLGDLLDGFDGKTTRGGHELPQNMTNEEVFDLAIQFKLYVLDNLCTKYKKIIVNNICNDNHSGSFGYFVNSAVKMISKQRYSNVKVVNHRKFLNHYYVGKIAFIITHGKDDKALKFGFSVQPKPQDIEKIDQYCKRNDIYRNSDLVVFKKGDSHQSLFDECTSDDFFYYNYPAFSPSSNWIKNNYKFGRRGFVLETFKGTETETKKYFYK